MISCGLTMPEDHLLLHEVFAFWEFFRKEIRILLSVASFSVITSCSSLQLGSFSMHVPCDISFCYCRSITFSCNYLIGSLQSLIGWEEVFLPFLQFLVCQGWGRLVAKWHPSMVIVHKAFQGLSNDAQENGWSWDMWTYRIPPPLGDCSWGLTLLTL